MSLAEVSRLYSVKNMAMGDEHVKLYKMPRYYKESDKDGGDLVKLYPEDEKKKKSFLNIIIARSKEIPSS